MLLARSQWSNREQRPMVRFWGGHPAMPLTCVLSGVKRPEMFTASLFCFLTQQRRTSGKKKEPADAVDNPTIIPRVGCNI
jgi:hypothetical protein